MYSEEGRKRGSYSCGLRELKMHRRGLWIAMGCAACLLGLVLGHAVVRAENDEAEGGTELGSIRGMLNSPYAKLAEAVVYVMEVKGKEFELPEQNPVIDQQNKIFIPRVLPVLVGSTVDFPNTDDVRHSVYTREGSANDFNLGQYDAGIVKHVTLDNAGITHLACNVHTEMSAYIISLPNPHFAISDRKSKTFLIPNVPPGTYELTFFHEKIGSATLEVTVEPGKETYVEFTKLKRKR